MATIRLYLSWSGTPRVPPRRPLRDAAAHPLIPRTREALVTGDLDRNEAQLRHDGAWLETMVPEPTTATGEEDLPGHRLDPATHPTGHQSQCPVSFPRATIRHTGWFPRPFARSSSGSRAPFYWLYVLSHAISIQSGLIRLLETL